MAAPNPAPQQQQQQLPPISIPTLNPLVPPPPHQHHQPQAARSPTRRLPPSSTGGALQDETLRDVMVRLDRHAQMLLDRVAPYKKERWLSLVALLLIFFVRMFLLEGFYIVAYVLFIFILNQFILFLQPKDRAALLRKASSSASPSCGATTDAAAAATNKTATAAQTTNNINNTTTTITDGGGDAELPTLDDEEFRPFVRRLPEFKFWYSSTNATVIAIVATFFKFIDVPVFWPLLLLYFIILFVATMRRQWLDMKKLKYVPWDIGSKKVYRSDPKRVSVARSPTTNSAAAVMNSSTRAAAPVPTIQITPKKVAAQSANAATL